MDSEYSSNGIDTEMHTYQSTVYSLFEKNGFSYSVAVDSSYLTPAEKADLVKHFVDYVTAQ